MRCINKMTVPTRLYLIGITLAMSCVPALPQRDSSTAHEAYEAFLRKDYATAFRSWKPLADRGDASAQYNLGILYERGLGVRHDSTEAFTLFHSAAAQGL